MKKCKKIFITALSMLIVVSAAAGSAFATPADNGSIDNFVQDTMQPMPEAPDISEMTLVGTTEQTEGDLRVVTEIYTCDPSDEALTAAQNADRNAGIIPYEDQITSQNATTNSNREFFYARMKVYNSSEQSSICLMEMYVSGLFSWNKDDNIVRVDYAYEPNYSLFISGQEYPKVVGTEYERRDNQGGYWGGNKYAYIQYIVKLKKSASESEIACSLYLEVNVKGVRRVVCSPSNICYELYN